MTLHFGAVQIGVLATFLGLAAALAAVFVLVARRASREVAFDEVRDVGYRVRKRWLLFLAAALASTLAALSFFLPYASGRGPVTQVRVVGGQFYWSLSPDVFHRGERVRFDVTSADVNHGFGLYDPDGKLIGSVQAMPGYHNRLTVTLTKPGEYTVACLEFCGLSHHLMIRQFDVKP